MYAYPAVLPHRYRLHLLAVDLWILPHLSHRLTGLPFHTGFLRDTLFCTLTRTRIRMQWIYYLAFLPRTACSHNCAELIHLTVWTALRLGRLQFPGKERFTHCLIHCKHVRTLYHTC